MAQGLLLCMPDGWVRPCPGCGSTDTLRAQGYASCCPERPEWLEERKVEDPSAQSAILNSALEDMLAYATSEPDRKIVMRTAALVLTEYLARELGRRQAAEFLEQMQQHVRTAQPSQPWPE